jgi:23S rRNA (pseudouridine1915-N3)-methyltransferase
MTNLIKIIAVGRIKEKYIQDAISEYEKRIRPLSKFNIIEIKDEGIIKESEKIGVYLQEKNKYLLDPAGKQFTSEEFSDFIKKSDSEITFIVGGFDGVSEKVKKDARMISLSKMTFTHEMTRLFLVEQIYRAFMIINNRKYHK